MSTETDFDVIVIGGGPGGYESAIRCAQLGMKTACIDKRLLAGEPSLGGTCLNVGCIPSKALLDSSHRFESAQHELIDHGIETGEVSIDIETMMTRKDKVVKQLTGGVAQLLKGNGIEWFKGAGKLTQASDSSFDVEFTPHEGEARSLTAKNLILASGSVPIDIPSAPVDQDLIVDSTGALEFTETPKRLGVIGAGVIGLELGSVWRRLGSEVVIFEALSELLPMCDKAIARSAKQLFKKQGLEVRLSTKVSSTEVKNNQVEVTLEDGSTEVFDKLIVCVGRKAYSEGLLAEGVTIPMTDRGLVEVDDSCATSIKGLYAIGDLVRGPMLAHKAMEEGMMVAERIHGEKAQVNYDTIINVVYTHPEIAWVGINEEEAKEQGIEVKSGQFPLAANGRALATADSDGFVKIISCAKTDRILGMHALAPGAGDMVHQGMIGMEFGALTEDFQLMTFAHPTLSEAVHEAALSVDGRAIHAIQRKR